MRKPAPAATLLLALLALAACQSTATTPARSDPSIPDMRMDRPQTYEDPGGLFSIALPSTWQAEPSTTLGAQIVQFREPRENAAIVTTVLTSTQLLGSSAMAAMLAEHVRATYGEQPGFAQYPAKLQSDGSQLIVWGYDAPASAGRPSARMLGNSFIEQRGQHIAFISTVVPSAAYAHIQPDIDSILNSYHLAGPALDTQAAALSPVTIRETQAYTATGDLFGVSVPEGWKQSDTSTPGQVRICWDDPSSNGYLIVSVLHDDSQRTEAERAMLLTNVITQSFSGIQGFSAAEPQLQDDGQLHVEWRYLVPTPSQGTAQMIGHSFIQQRRDKIGILSLVLPASQDAELRPATQRIFASLWLNEQAAFP